MPSRRVAGYGLLVASALCSLPALAESNGSGAGPAPKSGKHCALQAEPRWVARQTVFAQSSPLGAELQLELGPCWPLLQIPSPLFEYSRVAAGALIQATGGYVNAGLFAELVPLSVLGFRLSVAGVQYFPAGLDRTGYLRLGESDGTFRVQDWPAEAKVVSATGYNVVASSWQAIELELRPGLAVFAYNEIGLEHWSLGSGPYYYNSRWDLVLARRDDLLRDDALLGLSLKLQPQLSLQLGGVSMLKAVPSSDYGVLRVGGAANLSWVRPESALRSLDAFLALALPVTHTRQYAPTLCLAVTAGWELGAL